MCECHCDEQCYILWSPPVVKPTAEICLQLYFIWFCLHVKGSIHLHYLLAARLPSVPVGGGPKSNFTVVIGRDKKINICTFGIFVGVLFALFE